MLELIRKYHDQGLAAFAAQDLAVAIQNLTRVGELASTCGFSCPSLGPPEDRAMYDAELGELNRLCKGPCVLYQERQVGRWEYRKTELTRTFAEALLQLGRAQHIYQGGDFSGAPYVCRAFRMRPEVARAAIKAIPNEARWKRIVSRIEKRCVVSGGFTTEVEFLPGVCGATPDALRNAAERVLHPENDSREWWE